MSVEYIETFNFVPVFFKCVYYAAGISSFYFFVVLIFILISIFTLCCCAELFHFSFLITLFM